MGRGDKYVPTTHPEALRPARADSMGCILATPRPQPTPVRRPRKRRSCLESEGARERGRLWPCRSTSFAARSARRASRCVAPRTFPTRQPRNVPTDMERPDGSFRCSPPPAGVPRARQLLQGSSRAQEVAPPPLQAAGPVAHVRLANPDGKKIRWAIRSASAKRQTDPPWITGDGLATRCPGRGASPDR